MLQGFVLQTAMRAEQVQQRIACASLCLCGVACVSMGKECLLVCGKVARTACWAFFPFPHRIRAGLAPPPHNRNANASYAPVQRCSFNTCIGMHGRRPQLAEPVLCSQLHMRVITCVNAVLCHTRHTHQQSILLQCCVSA